MGWNTKKKLKIALVIRTKKRSGEHCQTMCEAHGKKIKKQQRPTSFILNSLLVTLQAVVSTSTYRCHLRYEGQCPAPEVGGGGSNPHVREGDARRKFRIRGDQSGRGSGFI